MQISKLKKVTKKAKFIESNSSEESVDEKDLCNDSSEGTEEYDEEICTGGALVVSFKRGYCKVLSRHGSVAIMRWNSEERAFAVEAYFSSGCSVIATQRAFRNRFNLAPLAPVPDRKSIVTWVTTFRQTASPTKRRTGVPRPVRSPQNIEAVRASMLRSPRRSARKHASALRLSDRSVRRILRDDLHFHPYKMAIVQELSEQISNDICELKKTVQSLEKQNAGHYDKIDALEPYRRRHNILIFGVVENDSENTDILVTKIFNVRTYVNNGRL
ncbi:hypothetical protein ILUMI_16161 [Ignelater luminosus]|uniref:DUF4817 domain-containing protein n=1 Tax=Ignelater luminosus TaxID=2038154 RepID=A0A8K0CRJ8_IGNLU|nr:hypothetical protein ILUMI_16161 [Ignelater luminosus]